MTIDKFGLTVEQTWIEEWKAFISAANKECRGICRCDEDCQKESAEVQEFLELP